MNRVIQFIVLSVLLFLVSSFSLAPLHVINNSLLAMRIGRSVDNDEVHYFIQLDNAGGLNSDRPVELYWKNAATNKLEKVNYIKKTFGYDVKVTKFEKDYCEFHLVSYDKRSFHIKKNYWGDFKIYTMSNGEEVEVKRIFVNIDGGSFWIPNVTHVDLFGYCPKKNKFIHEIIEP